MADDSLLDRLVTVIEKLEDRLETLSAGQKAVSEDAKLDNTAQQQTQQVLAKLQNAISGSVSGSPSAPSSTGNNSATGPVINFSSSAQQTITNAVNSIVNAVKGSSGSGSAKGGGIGNFAAAMGSQGGPKKKKRAATQQGGIAGWANKATGWIESFTDSISDPGGLSKQGRRNTKRGNKWTGATQQFAGGMIESFQDPNEFTGAGKGLGTAGKLAGNLLPAPIGKPIQAITGLGEAAFKAIDRIKKWSESLHQANMQFAEFSAAMNMVQAQKEMRDIALSQERGDRRAAGAERLAESQTRLERATAPIEDSWGVIKSELSALLNDVGTVLLTATGLVALSEGFLSFYNWIRGRADEDKPINYGEYMQQLSEDFAEKQGTPGRWR